MSGHSCSMCTFKPHERLCDIIDNLPRLESEIAVDVKMALVYVAGYVHRNEGCLDDTHNIYSQYGSYFDSLNLGNLVVPGDCVFKWSFFCYIMFYEIARKTCINFFSKIFLLISYFYQFAVSRRQCRTLCNIFFNNYSALYSPRSEKEPRQKILKLSS